MLNTSCPQLTQRSGITRPSHNKICSSTGVEVTCQRESRCSEVDRFRARPPGYGRHEKTRPVQKI